MTSVCADFSRDGKTIGAPSLVVAGSGAPGDVNAESDAGFCGGVLGAAVTVVAVVGSTDSVPVPFRTGAEVTLPILADDADAADACVPGGTNTNGAEPSRFGVGSSAKSVVSRKLGSGSVDTHSLPLSPALSADTNPPLVAGGAAVFDNAEADAVDTDADIEAEGNINDESDSVSELRVAGSERGGDVLIIGPADADLTNVG
jgi:hypothetical protein